MRLARLGALAMIGVGLAGCAPIISGAMNAGTSQDDVVTKTALYFAAEPADLTITEIDKGVLRTTYRTTYKGVLYNCQIYYGEVNCAEPGSGLGPG